jgi:hypothetical protein
MSDPILHLSRPADTSLSAIHRPDTGARAPYPVWRLMLAALFMASAALTGAAVVIFGAPGGVDAGASQGGPVRMQITR